MELSKEHLIKLISELDLNIEYDYVKTGDSKVLLTNVDIDSQVVSFKRINGEKEDSYNLSGDRLTSLVNACKEKVPVNIDALFSGGSNDRSAIEAILARTKEFSVVYLQRKKHIVWLPNQPHIIGEIKNVSSDGLIVNNIHSTQSLSIINEDLEKEYTTSELKSLFKRYHDCYEKNKNEKYTDYTIKALVTAFCLRYGKSLKGKSQAEIQDITGYGVEGLTTTHVFGIIKDGELGLSFYEKSKQVRKLDAITKSINKKLLVSLRTKPFLLLAGISGTGKSRIVKEMAYASCPDEDDLRKDDVAPGNYLLVEVKPNWHDSTELLGYESTIKENYILTPFVKFLYKAMKYPNVPFFVCLDEMNLAPVEQYFAEFLSILESRKLLEDGKTILSEPLIKAEIFKKYPKLALELSGKHVIEKPQNNSGYMLTSSKEKYIPMEDEYKELQEKGLRIPQNVLVIGTVNMDETTHQFSRKVIDRAMTIEMNEVKFDAFFDSNDELGYTDEPLGKEYFLPKYTSAKNALESIPEDAEWIKEEVPNLLEQLNKALDDTPFKVAYRVQNELVLYFVSLREEAENKDLTTEELLNKAMDGILMMKVLPRIEGDRDLLEKPLKRLTDYVKNYTSASAKIEEMQKRLDNSHFTSFWP